MFKKFKDKLAEEVKSSPQRIQQFAQAAQAAVTSASSSISDITNNDLFSIGDNDTVTKNKASPNNQSKVFQEVSLVQPGNSQQNIDTDYHMNSEMSQEYQRQRRLSNSSFASDISFRLPSYESPSMYHLQSDMEVSASEAEEKGFSGTTVNLDRVTKEQLYSAYRRTQDRCTKYKTQYADLARHYKLLERENAKARNVLVETQDKALRRISELREQCSLEQSAKAHLEKALRIEIEEKIMKIEALSTQLNILQNNDSNEHIVHQNKLSENDNEAPLISLEADDLNNVKKTIEEVVTTEAAALNNKIEKMEQLLNKYKDSLKSTKEKNAQQTIELQMLSAELETKVKENEQLKATTTCLAEYRKKIQELNEIIEELQNKNNSYEFSKSKEMSILEINYKNAKEEITQLREKIEVLSKREEEYAISLAENKLSIHKELESKEAEIKSLKDSVTKSNNEIQSLNIILNDYKNNLSQLEEIQFKLKNEVSELNLDKTKVGELKSELETLTQKYHSLEQLKSKLDEEYNCLQLQMKQETAEKLAMIDRNTYLENRNSQLLEENTKKSSQISSLQSELSSIKLDDESKTKIDELQKLEEQKYVDEINLWKSKCSNLESEIQDERVELVKLQSEIEKLLLNHESIQKQNEQLNTTVDDMKSQIISLKRNLIQIDEIKKICKELKIKTITLKKQLRATSDDSKSAREFINSILQTINEKFILLNETMKRDFAQFDKVIEDLRLKNVSLQLDTQKISDQYKNSSNECNRLVKENEILKTTIQELKLDNEVHLQKNKELLMQNEAFFTKLNDFTTDSEKLSENIKSHDQEKKLLTEQINTLQKENEDLHLKVIEGEKTNELSKNECTKLSDMYDDVLNKLNSLTQEHNDLILLKEDFDEKKKTIRQLQKRVDDLVHENETLMTVSKSVNRSIEEMELELKEVRKSHAQIEIEKEHLNSVITELQNKSKVEKQLKAESMQTDLYDIEKQSQLLIDCQAEADLLKGEINQLKDMNGKLTEENDHNKLEIKKLESLSTINNDRNMEFDSLKEENRRLQSDIESSQSYLTKVSKENSQLNDKLRELIASNDNFPDKNDMLTRDLENLREELNLEKDKIEDLIRENNLLAEENLELKDQIKSQCYSQSKDIPDNNCINNEDILLKYNNLIETKSQLEKKLKDSELINQSINGNMQQIQANNEKLRLSNEKLERRLDEALVSLRHLHSLQENTELEYLKNILYEYLTGSGTHSITLAKVLAAVVKFDDRQTETVLQKEKERQGLLRQLGII